LQAGAEGHQLSVNPYSAEVSLTSAFDLCEGLGVPAAQQKERRNDQAMNRVHGFVPSSWQPQHLLKPPEMAGSSAQRISLDQHSKRPWSIPWKCTEEACSFEVIVETPREESS